FCTGGSVTLTGVANDGVAPFTYAWTDPNNVTGAPSSSPTVAANIAGTWTVTVTDACGGPGATASVTVSEVAVPTATITATAPICSGGDVTLTCNTNNATSFLWGGAAPVGGSTTQDVTITGLTSANDGNYTVVSTNAGCSSSTGSYTLTVSPTPNIVSTTSTPNPVCYGTDGALNVVATLPSPTYCIPGYSFGCSFPDIVSNVTFNTLNRTSGCDQLTATGYSNISSPTAGSVVAGSSYPISVTTDGDVEGMAAWIDFNRNGVFEASELVLSNPPTSPPATTTGTVLIPLTAVNGTTRIRVRCIYNQDPTGLADPACSGVTYGETEDYRVTITGGVDPLTYAWSPATYLSATDVSNPTAVAMTATTPYSVLVGSDAGCTATGNVTVDVNALPIVDCGGPYGPYCMNDADVTLTGSPVGGTWSGTGVTAGGVFDPSAGSSTLTYSYTD
ncbi:MAG TPA: GEVED domain-containing protein, partial [Flavobacteriales bacterium]|nr:GEVED domain-containing protein [Flavobacteriales bacterium]